jgi:cob(I)alamin adenosyltransferase
MPLKKGCIQVYTGEGKGKTTASVGLAVRARGSDLRVIFVQFVKGGSMSGELAMLRKLGVEVVRTAEKNSGLMTTGGLTEEDYAAAAEAWKIAENAISSGNYDLVICDEINVAMHYNMIKTNDVIHTLTNRPESVEVVCTGRNVPELISDMADLITEMKPHKHPYQQGIPARRGIEF